MTFKPQEISGQPQRKVVWEDFVKWVFFGISLTAFYLIFIGLVRFFSWDFLEPFFDTLKAFNIPLVYPRNCGHI